MEKKAGTMGISYIHFIWTYHLLQFKMPECPSGLRAFTRPTGMLQSDFFRDTIDQLHKELFYLVFYFQGEPFLNPEFLEMVKYAASKITLTPVPNAKFDVPKSGYRIL